MVTFYNNHTNFVTQISQTVKKPNTDLSLYLNLGFSQISKFVVKFDLRFNNMEWVFEFYLPTHIIE